MHAESPKLKYILDYTFDWSLKLKDHIDDWITYPTNESCEGQIEGYSEYPIKQSIQCDLKYCIEDSNEDSGPC